VTHTGTLPPYNAYLGIPQRPHSLPSLPTTTTPLAVCSARVVVGTLLVVVGTLVVVDSARTRSTTWGKKRVGCEYSTHQHYSSTLLINTTHQHYPSTLPGHTARPCTRPCTRPWFTHPHNGSDGVQCTRVPAQHVRHHYSCRGSFSFLGPSPRRGGGRGGGRRRGRRRRGRGGGKCIQCLVFAGLGSKKEGRGVKNVSRTCQERVKRERCRVMCRVTNVSVVFHLFDPTYCTRCQCQVHNAYPSSSSFGAALQALPQPVERSRITSR
jgi:hypothetical protein